MQTNKIIHKTNDSKKNDQNEPKFQMLNNCHNILLYKLL